MKTFQNVTILCTLPQQKCIYFIENCKSIKKQLKVKCPPIPGHQGTKGVQLQAYIGIRWGWVVNATSIHIVQKAGWPLGPVLTGTERRTPTKFRAPKRIAQSKCLYRLRYPAQYNYGKILDPVSLHITINVKMLKVGKFALMKWLICFPRVSFSLPGPVALHVIPRIP